MRAPGKSHLPYLMALVYALTKDLKGSAVELPKGRKPTFTERRKAEEAKRRQRK